MSLHCVSKSIVQLYVKTCYFLEHLSYATVILRFRQVSAKPRKNAGKSFGRRQFKLGERKREEKNERKREVRTPRRHL